MPTYETKDVVASRSPNRRVAWLSKMIVELTHRLAKLVAQRDEAMGQRRTKQHDNDNE